MDTFQVIIVTSGLTHQTKPHTTPHNLLFVCFYYLLDYSSLDGSFPKADSRYLPSSWVKFERGGKDEKRVLVKALFLAKRKQQKVFIRIDMIFTHPLTHYLPGWMYNTIIMVHSFKSTSPACLTVNVLQDEMMTEEWKDEPKSRLELSLVRPGCLVGWQKDPFRSHQTYQSRNKLSNELSAKRERDIWNQRTRQPASRQRFVIM